MSVGLVIVMPVLDEASTLAAKLTALQPLRAVGVVLLVVDGGSRDASVDIGALYADRVLRAPRGRAAQMNAGAVASDADVLLFLHADTVLPPGADRLVMGALAGGAVWGRFDVRIDSARPLLRCVGAMMNLRSRLTGIATGDQAMFMTRAAFDAAGGFPDLPIMEDLALSVRLRELGRPACLRAQVATSARRWEQHGAWRTIFLMWRLRAAWFFGADAALLARRYGYKQRTD